MRNIYLHSANSNSDSGTKTPLGEDLCRVLCLMLNKLHVITCVPHIKQTERAQKLDEFFIQALLVSVLREALLDLLAELVIQLRE